jgi:ribonuclease-3
MIAAPVETLQKKLDHCFRDPNVLRAALTHSSAGDDYNYERLEFLGDRVLGLVITELLFEKFPHEAEGDLAKRLAALVQGSLLAEVAHEMDLGAYIIFSDAEAQAGGAKNDNILSDVLEAVLGALYLEAGLAHCRTVIEKLWGTRLYDMKTPPQHPKTALQEWAQAKALPLPIYKVSAQHGPDHAPLFDIELSVQGYQPITAQGASRQDAEKEAARLFMAKVERKK